ncbi:hypothetical protein HS041_12160 [Planomonospora sp. ID67723]|uniref:hypothetical protein n=1 Tax=Planomonospora sp. ID67723 TaxID=2738134 RepID=UPI0018C43A42|nr:hypothetical protein [Planomonospora sp. ID67723]MBG0828522.1 hypothetical protein [Planomonospora sp. ID67723]
MSETTETRELMYAASADDLRRELLQQADASDRICKEIHSKGRDTWAATDKDILLANLLLGTYAYNLAGLLGWIGREFGEDAKHRAAWVMDDSLMNGDDRDLNGDILPLPPETPESS